MPLESKTLVIELPFPMPTWNRVLAMQHFQRAKMRTLLHRLVSIYIPLERASLIPMASVINTQSTSLLIAELLKMIRPSTSSKSRSAKSKVCRNEQS
jgi:hypothetical protein